MRYEQLRLVVVPKLQRSIFAVDEPDQTPETRTAFLGRCFALPIEFPHRGTTFLYKPAHTAGGLIAASIGRENPEVTRRRADGFAPREVEDWDFANVLFDLSATEQKVLFQIVRKVGRPFPIMKSLCDYINATEMHSNWDILPHTMPSTEEFYSVAHANLGNISEIEFTFAVPNIVFTISDAIRKNLGRLRDHVNAQEVVTAMRNREGNINPDDEEIADGVEAVANGVASTKIKSEGGKIIYNSENKRKIVDIPDDTTIQDLREEGLRGFLERMGRLWLR